MDIDDVPSSEPLDVDVANKGPAPIILHVLPLIKDIQRQHGLRHDDYQRYRQYCTRRLDRVRHCLHFTHGKTKFQKRSIDAATANKDVRYFHILLFLTERAWSYSMQLKQQVAIEHRHAFHSMQRLRKAVKHASEFAQLVKEANITDARSQLEVTAYTSWMQATLEFELQNWEGALALFGQSKLIYEKVHDICGELQKPLYLQRVDEINANLRYCAHSLGVSGDLNELIRSQSASSETVADISAKIDEAVIQSRKVETATFEEISWEGKTVGIKNEKLRSCVAHTRDIEFQLENAAGSSHETVMHLYDELFVAFNDGLGVINTDIQGEERAAQKMASQKSEANVAQLRFLQDYLTFLRLTKMLERNMLIANHIRSSVDNPTPSSLSRPDDVVRIFDNLIQNVADLSEINSLKDNMSFAKKIAAQTLYFKSFRCLYIAESHRMAEKVREALALYDRVAINVRTAIAHYQQCSEDVKTPLQELQDLLDVARGRKFTIHAKCFLDTHEAHATAPSSEPVDASKPLILDADHYRSNIDLKNPNLIAFPPQFEAIACKPLFFDLASHHLSFPSLEARKTRKTAATMVTGFIKSFFTAKK